MQILSPDPVSWISVRRGFEEAIIPAELDDDEQKAKIVNFRSFSSCSSL